MRALILTVAMATILRGQSATPVVRAFAAGAGISDRVEDVGPVQIPTSDTDVATATRYVISLTMSNHTGADVTCKVMDKQGTPLGLFGRSAAGSTVTNGTSLRWEWTAVGNRPTSYPMRGGVTWSCSAAGVVGHIVWEY